MKIFQKVLGLDNVYTEISYNNIGKVYESMSNYLKALEYYGKSLKIRLKISGEDESIATSYNNIGVVYKYMTNY